MQPSEKFSPINQNSVYSPFLHSLRSRWLNFSFYTSIRQEAPRRQMGEDGTEGEEALFS
jgi:hypothetical protein